MAGEHYRMKKVRIFAASPSDMALERSRIDKVTSTLKPFSEHLGVLVEVIDWTSVVPDMGRPEDVILRQINPSSWDVFIGILWHRFGTPPANRDPKTQREYLSGTEEEFQVAVRLWEKFRKPRIMMYRCVRPLPIEQADAEQWKRVTEFFNQFDAKQGRHPGLYKRFESTEDFERTLTENLQTLILELTPMKGARLTEELEAFGPKNPNNLPPRQPFFGREEEIGIALRALSPEDRTWGVLLDGIGGIGKTALALETAYICKDRKAFDSFIFISAKENLLNPTGIREVKPAARTRDEFLDETGRRMGHSNIAELPSNEKRRALLDALRDSKTLLVFDNLETLTKVEQEELADFLRELPNASKAIITSRRRGGEGAVWLRLDKLEWEASRSIILNEMNRDKALAAKLKKVFVARWQELYDETKGSPLALVRVLGLMRVQSTLTFEGALMLLRGNRDPDLDRFVFREARREMMPSDEMTLGALSFFTPSATPESCRVVSGLTANALESSLNRLSRLSLVNDLVGDDRFALHPLTRSFVREELLSNERLAFTIGNRFAAYWLDYAKRFAGIGGRSYQNYDQLDAEWTNLEAAVEWFWKRSTRPNNSRQNDALSSFCEFVMTVGQFLWFSGRWDERRDLCVCVYESLKDLKHTEAGWAAYYVAWIHLSRGQVELASTWSNRCLEVWRLGGSPIERATGFRLSGLVAAKRGEDEKAESLLNDSLVIYRREKSDNIAKVIFELGQLHQKRGNFKEAEKNYAEALRLAGRLSSKEETASYSCALAFLMIEQGRFSEARKWAEGSLDLATHVGRKDFIGLANYALAKIHEAEGRKDLALPLAEEAAMILERLRHTSLPNARHLVMRLKRSN
jgi:tetratricopeptide (TPR) repeat protein